MTINISGTENFTEVCWTFGSVFKVGKSDTLQLRTVKTEDVETDVKTESLGESTLFCYCKITRTEKWRKNIAHKTSTCVSVLGCTCKCASVCVCVCVCLGAS